jgi:hypothetical protein
MTSVLGVAVARSALRHRPFPDDPVNIWSASTERNLVKGFLRTPDGALKVEKEAPVVRKRSWALATYRQDTRQSAPRLPHRMQCSAWGQFGLACRFWLRPEARTARGQPELRVNSNRAPKDTKVGDSRPPTTAALGQNHLRGDRAPLEQ